ncbi:cAMP-binding protein [Labrenzia sp. OB1]|nr:cAMP-binding protein [Labrenzia sp. OB1]
MENDAFDPNLRQLFLKNATRNVYTNNGVIYLQEDRADKLYIVLSGYVRLSYIMEDGSTILYAIVPPGQSFGELGVYDWSVYMDSATAIGDVSVFSVRAEVFHSDISGNSSPKDALSTLIVDRYKTFIDVTRCLHLSNLPARLAASLLRLVESLGQTTDYRGRNCPSLGAMVTQSDLGAMARGTRGNVNRVLRKWILDGLVAIEDRKIILLDPDGLELTALNVGDN